MKKQLRLILERYGKLSLRERMLLGVTLAGGIGFSWHLWFWQPASLVQQQQADRHAALQAQIAELETQIASLSPRQQEDPDAANRSHQRRLLRENERLELELQALTEGFIDPAQMAQVLQEILAEQQGLRLLALESLPVTNVLATADDKEQEGQRVYRHGLELRLEGRYLDVLAYVEALEGLPWRFYWDSMAIRVTEAPQTIVTLRVHTLSLNENLLGV